MQLIDSIKPTELAEQIGVTESTLATWRCRNKGPALCELQAAFTTCAQTLKHGLPNR